MKAFSVSWETRQGHPLLLVLFSIVLEDLARAISQGKEIKGIQIWNEGIQLLLFADDITLYTDSPKDSTKNLINNFSKVARYKVNLQKAIVFLYTNIERSEKMKKTLPNHKSIKNKIPKNKFY